MNILTNDIYNAATWQYIGFNNEGSFLYHPLSEYTAGCPGLYDPRKRPWYLSAVTGPINLVIMIDISDSRNAVARIDVAKQTARELMSTVSYWAFINVCIYTSDTSCMSQQLVRGTTDNLQATEEYISNIRVSGGKYVGVNDALNEAYDMVDYSIRQGSASNCETIIVFLSSDHNDLTTQNSIDSIIDDYPDVESSILSYAFNLDNNVAVDKVYKEMSCATNGIHREFTQATSAIVDDIVTSFTEYFGTVVRNTNVRYSEIYEDNLGLGDILTGAIPFYQDIVTDDNLTVSELVGVYGIDLQISAINNNGQLSNDEIMGYLASSSTCPDVNPSADALTYLRDGDICYVAEDAYYGSGEKLDTQKDKEMFDLIASFGFLGTLCILCTVAWFSFDHVSTKERCGVMGWTLLIYCTFGIALIVYTLVNNWETTVVIANWSHSTMTVLETTIDTAVCCEKINCVCLEYSGGNTCADNKRDLVDGLCGDGYACCEEVCSQCNCHSDHDGGQSCDTCCECNVEVYHKQCEVNCDTCFNGIVVWSYLPKESKTDQEVILNYKKKCGYGKSEDCALKYIEAYPVGSKHDIFYNPNNWLDTISEEEGDYPSNYFDVIIALTVMMCIPYIMIGYLACRNRALDPNPEVKYDGGTSQTNTAASELERPPPPSYTLSGPTNCAQIPGQPPAPVAYGYSQPQAAYGGYPVVQSQPHVYGHVPQQPPVVYGYPVQAPQQAVMGYNAAASLGTQSQYAYQPASQSPYYEEEQPSVEMSQPSAPPPPAPAYHNPYGKY
jgi:hypothetical protein